MFHAPNKHRLRNHSFLGSDDSYGNNGVFFVPIDKKIIAQVIASDGEGWEHVSVVILEDGEEQTPTWDEMSAVKDIFWDKEDTVIQFHPPQREYVNNHTNCLHLWRKTGYDFPLPDSILIGIK